MRFLKPISENILIWKDLQIIRAVFFFTSFKLRQTELARFSNSQSHEPQQAKLSYILEKKLR